MSNPHSTSSSTQLGTRGTGRNASGSSASSMYMSGTTPRATATISPTMARSWLYRNPLPVSDKTTYSRPPMSSPPPTARRRSERWARASELAMPSEKLWKRLRPAILRSHPLSHLRVGGVRGRRGEGGGKERGRRGEGEGLGEGSDR
eukprot:1022908-Rhodomonas_salina.3